MEVAKIDQLSDADVNDKLLQMLVSVYACTCTSTCHIVFLVFVLIIAIINYVHVCMYKFIIIVSK